MKSRAEFLSLLRTRSAHELGDFYSVTACAPGDADGLWVGPNGRYEILAAPTSTATPGLLIRPREDAAKLPIIAALLSSNILGAAIARPLTIQTLEAFPLPARDALFEAQLEALWYYGSSNVSQDPASPQWGAILSSFDRILAELYHLTLDELMTFLL